MGLAQNSEEAEFAQNSEEAKFKPDKPGLFLELHKNAFNMLSHLAGCIFYKTLHLLYKF